ncbi:MAG: helix-turn-helix domain-containing protein [Acidimicrobiales bacterium]
MTSPTLVPPARLGRLLAQRRAAASRTPSELAAASNGWFTVADLAAIEAGERTLSDTEVSAVTELYGVAPGELVPERSALTIDLDERHIAAGAEARRLRGRDPEPDEVLATYLSLLYSLRHATPGTPLVLRQADVAVLSRALQLGTAEVETRLGGLMADPDRLVATRTDQLRRRVLVPVAGVVVAVLAGGAAARARDDAPSSSPTSTVTVTSEAPVTTPTAAPESTASTEAPPPATDEVPTTLPDAPPVDGQGLGPGPAPAGAATLTTAGRAATAAPAPAAPRSGPARTTTPSVTVTPDGVGLIPPETAVAPPTTPPTTTTPDGVVLIPPETVVRDVPPAPDPTDVVVP